MRKISVLFICLLISSLAVSCALRDSNETTSGLGFAPGWQKGDSWVVEVDFWPQRLKDPDSRSDTPVRRAWHYRVEDSQSDAGHYVKQYSPGDTYLLIFSDNYNLLETRRWLEEKQGVGKYSSEQTNQLAGGLFFYLPDNEHPPLIWYQPSLLDFGVRRQRFNFHRWSSSYGDWVVQRVEQEADEYYIEVRHSPSQSVIQYWWNKTEPWPRRVVWRRRDRVVATANLR